MLKLVNISKQFDDRLILEHVNYIFPDHGLFGLKGESGTGKTTLLYLISGFLKPTQGQILFNGKPINKHFHRDYLSFMKQNNDLIRFLTVKENILCGAKIAKIHYSKEEYENIIHQLQLKSLENKYPHELSGGEIKRVSLARALLKKSPILLCDEPTGALHQEMAHEIMKMLKKLGEKILVIVVSHQTDLLKQYCDHIVTIDKQTLIGETFMDEHQEVMIQKKHHSFFKFAFKRILYQKNTLIRLFIFQVIILTSIFLLIDIFSSVKSVIYENNQSNPVKNINLVMNKEETELSIKEGYPYFDASMGTLKQGRAVLLPGNTSHLSFIKGSSTKDKYSCVITSSLDKALNHPKTINYHLDKDIELKVTGVLKNRIQEEKIVYLNHQLKEDFKVYFNHSVQVIEGNYETVKKKYKNYEVINEANLEKEGYQTLFQAGELVGIIFIIISLVSSIMLILIVFETLYEYREKDDALMISLGAKMMGFKKIGLVEGAYIALGVFIFSSLINLIINYFSDSIPVLKDNGLRLTYSPYLLIVGGIYLLLLMFLGLIKNKNRKRKQVVEILREDD